jgi:trehalose 6-phosphate phosphatase
MKHVLGAEGQAALHGLLSTRALLAFDFDGTLAPIVADPRTARIALPVSRALRALSTRWPIAVVTGRTVADVSERLGFDAWAIVGNHGAEDLAFPNEVDPARLDGVRQALESEAGRRLLEAGVLFEDKGKSMALHYRLARDRERAFEAAWRFARELGPSVEVFDGRMVLNIVVPGAPDKGDALQRLVKRCGADAALFIGDDINDEPAFRSAEPHWVTIKVGREAQSAARFFLDATAEMAVLLDHCVKVMSRLE